MFDCRLRWFSVCFSCMIHSDHVAISTAQELISVGWLVSKRAICSWKADDIPLHCVGCWAIMFCHNWYLMSKFSCWMVQASLLNVQCVDVRWYTLAMKGKNYTWPELLPDMLGVVFHKRRWKISQCIGPLWQMHTESGSVCIFSNQTWSMFCLWSAYDSLVREALLMYFITPCSFQI